jgi:hypothetical protein
MSSATWAEVKQKAAEKRQAEADLDAPEATEPEPELIEPVPTPRPPGTPLTRRYGGHGGRGCNGGAAGKRKAKLVKGQEAEAQAFREGRGVPRSTDGVVPTPKFVKTPGGVFVQTRGPVVLVKADAGKWLIYRLEGRERIRWADDQEAVLEYLERAVLIDGPHGGLRTAKEAARQRIAEADGELGS